MITCSACTGQHFRRRHAASLPHTTSRSVRPGRRLAGRHAAFGTTNPVQGVQGIVCAPASVALDTLVLVRGAKGTTSSFRSVAFGALVWFRGAKGIISAAQNDAFGTANFGTHRNSHPGTHRDSDQRVPPTDPQVDESAEEPLHFGAHRNSHPGTHRNAGRVESGISSRETPLRARSLRDVVSNAAR